MTRIGGYPVAADGLPYRKSIRPDALFHRFQSQERQPEKPVRNPRRIRRPRPYCPGRAQNIQRNIRPDRPEDLGESLFFAMNGRAFALAPRGISAPHRASWNPLAAPMSESPATAVSFGQLSSPSASISSRSARGRRDTTPSRRQRQDRDRATIRSAASQCHRNGCIHGATRPLLPSRQARGASKVMRPTGARLHRLSRL